MIRQGTKPNGRVTMNDIAREAGTSRALVSLVMRDSPKVSTERRTRVLEAAAKLGYRPNALASSLRSRNTRIVGVLVGNLHNPVYTDVLDGISEVASAQSYRVLIGTGYGDPAMQKTALDTFLELRAEGLILLGPRLKSQEIVAAAAEAPTLVVGRVIRSPEIDVVTNNEHLGPSLAIRHLVELGHQRIVHLGGGAGAGLKARSSGYRAAMRACGLEREIRVVDGDNSELSGIEGVERLLKSPRFPTAIFAANDLVAIGAMDRLEDVGMSVPGDVSLVGFDNTHLAALRHISLTTVDQPRLEMGRLSMRTLLDRINGRTDAKKLLVTPSLVIRSTTAAPPKRPHPRRGPLPPRSSRLATDDLAT